MRMVDIILKKRNGATLTKEEIQFFIEGISKNQIPDYQTSALLMAIWFNGLNKEETVELTSAMTYSGEVIDLSPIPGIKVDKHSTGGVGDKTTLVLLPLVAAAGGKIAKMSGKAMGFSGGTLDKLMAFEGFSYQLSEKELIANVHKSGLALGGQSKNLVPADKILYGLRDVTGTIDNISLIAGSIMSKKLATGCDAMVLDVKTGVGAFMPDPEKAKELASLMVEIGNKMDRKIVAVISQMEQPLGNTVGNSLEVKEAIETLKGNGPRDLLELCLVLGAQMLILSNLSETVTEAQKILLEKIESGEAIEKLKALVQNQGGNSEQVEEPNSLPISKYTINYNSPKSGYLTKLDARVIGQTAMQLGAGREKKEDKIDLTAGIYLHKKIGDRVEESEKLATLYSNSENKLELGIKMIGKAYTIENQKIIAPKLILDIVD